MKVSTPAAVGVRDAAPKAGPIEVRHVDGEEYEIRIGGHRVRVDQPMESGGHDRGPTPTDLFVGSLAACVAFTPDAT